MPHDPRRGVISTAAAIELKPAPIEPSWVLEGDPQARNGMHSNNADGWAATYVWECSAGRFKWHFVLEETVMILEGDLKVTNAAGESHVLSAGSVGYFPAGTWWEWEVPRYVRKLAFIRREVPLAVRAANKLLKLVGLGSRP